MISNLINHSRVKHINIVYHYVRSKVIKERIIKIKYISIEQMIADGLIKPLKASKFLKFRILMRLFNESLSKADRGHEGSQ